MNVVDSSAWLEYFAGTDQAEPFVEAIEATDKLIVPVIVLYEVFKKIILTSGEDEALTAIAHLRQGLVVEIDEDIALSAVKNSIEHTLPLADSLIFTIARKHQATLYTQDRHFENIPGVRYFPKG